MYRTWEQMKEGWTKNLALLFRRPGQRAFMLSALWLLAWVAFLISLPAIISGHWRIAYYVLPMIFLYVRIAGGQFRTASNIVAIMFGLPLAAYLLWRSGSLQKKGVNWKGRTYRTRAA